MVTKNLDVSRDEMIANIAATLVDEIPGDEWVTIREVADSDSNLTYSSAAYRLNRAVENGIMEHRICGTTGYYRMVTTDDN